MAGENNSNKKPSIFPSQYAIHIFQMQVKTQFDVVQNYITEKQIKETIAQLEADMRHAAKEMKFEQAAEIRDRLKYLRERELQYI